MKRSIILIFFFLAIGSKFTALSQCIRMRTNDSESIVYEPYYSIKNAFKLYSDGKNATLISYNATSVKAKTDTMHYRINESNENLKDVVLSRKEIPLTVPDIAVYPISKDYGYVQVGYSVSQTFIVTNVGTAYLNVSFMSLIGSNPDEFSIAVGGGVFTLAPGEMYEVVVSFNPTSTGVKYATFQIWSNDPDDNPKNVQLIGTGIFPDIAVYPQSKNYQNVAVDCSESQIFIVSNESTGDLHVTNTILTGTDEEEFNIISGGDPFVLAAGETHEVIVQFKPDSYGLKMAILRFICNDPDENPFDVPLSGNGIPVPVPDISVDPMSINYGNVYVGSSSSQTLTISNEGTADLIVSTVSIIGYGDFSITSGGGFFTLAPSATRNVVVRFTPSSTGSKSAILRIQSNDPDEDPFDVSFAGNGSAIPEPDIAVFPPSKDYGSVQVGSNASQMFVVTNDGTTDLFVTNTSLTGANADQFSIDSGGGTFTQIPGETRDVVVSFRPMSTGEKTAILRFVSNDTDENPKEVMLSGTGIPIPIPDITVYPNSINYGNVAVNSSAFKTLTVTNDGTATLNVISANLIGTNAGEFSIVSGIAPFTLVPGANRAIKVNFHPISIGDKYATLRITSNDPDENPFDVYFSGICYAMSVPDIAVVPTSKDYDSVQVGSSASQMFMVINDGTADLIVANTSLAGTDSEEFHIDNNEGSFTLAPGDTHEVVVSFNPVIIGLKTSILRFICNDPDEDPKEVPLHGIGIDIKAPYICKIYPPPGAKNIPKNTNLKFLVKDDENRVDLSTLIVTINKMNIVSKGVSQIGDKVNITLNNSGYKIDYNKIEDFNEGEKVVVKIECKDQAIIPNILDTTYNFTIGKCRVTNKKKDTADQKVKTIKHDYTGIEVTIPAGALDDTTDIIIGIIEGQLDLPDSVDCIGSTYYFGPDGLQFEDSVTIRIPNSLVGLDISGLIDPTNMFVYYYSTTIGEWNRLNVNHESNNIVSNNTVSVKVKEFCYLAFGNLNNNINEITQTSNIQKNIELKQNYPNPFNLSTTIHFEVLKPDYVKLFIYDELGKLVRKLVNGQKSAGEYNIIWDGKNDKYNLVSSGIYYYQLSIGDYSFTKKAIMKK